MGCWVGAHSKSVDECKATCKANDGMGKACPNKMACEYFDPRCVWSFAGRGMSNCGRCGMNPSGMDKCSTSGVEDCYLGCEHAGAAA